MHDLAGVLSAAPQVDQTVLRRGRELGLSEIARNNRVAVGTDADADDVAVELGGEGRQRDRGEACAFVLFAQLNLGVMAFLRYDSSRTIRVGGLRAHAPQTLAYVLLLSDD